MLEANPIRNRSMQRHLRCSDAVSESMDDRERGKFSGPIQFKVDPLCARPELLPTLPPIADTRRPRVSGEKVPRLAPYTRQRFLFGRDTPSHF
jgi:hypothetical protein